jgi:hypothetical protein
VQNRKHKIEKLQKYTNMKKERERERERERGWRETQTGSDGIMGETDRRD